MLHPCEKSDIFAQSIYDTNNVTHIHPPQWPMQLRRIPFLFVISTITMLFICTSYTVNFISFKQIYFINICLLTCFYFNDICAINICFSAFVWPLPSRRANILHCWQTWCQNANSAPSKEIYQISGLHTRYRFSLEGSASKKPRGRNKNPDQAVISTAKIANVHVWPIFIRSRFRLVSKSCRRSCVSRALTGNSAP